VDPSGQEQQLRTVPLRIDPMAAAEPQDTMTPGAGEVQHGSVMPAPDEEIDLPLGHELRVEIAQPTEIAVLAGGDYREGEL